jgi:PelA/Pel-15E family pectate lyase
MQRVWPLVAVLVVSGGACGAAPGQQTDLRAAALEGLRRAVSFFRSQVAVHGTYLWQYSEDLALREGEGVASATQGWVQPPGTPSVGEAFLDAYEATGDPFYLDAARETARGLTRGQLQSGGWTYPIEFDPAKRARFAYRDQAAGRGQNASTLDDDTTQAALRFLIRADRALGFKDAVVHDSVRYGIECLLKAQYPNGAWPQRWDKFPEPDKFPVKPAAFPETWPRTWPGNQQYGRFYTLNDNALVSTIQTLLEASRALAAPVPGNDLSNLASRCRTAAEKAGEFLLLAQMPEPQPAWAQQYDFDMHPVWARKFEPPAITGGESQAVLRMLLELYRQTGQAKYLAPIPRALEYLRRSCLPDGRLARFYELRTNRPLYFTRQYELTYDDTDLPTHYAFKVADGTAAIARAFERLKAGSPRTDSSPAPRQPVRPAAPSLAQVKTILAALDDRGRWVEQGRLRYHRAPDQPKRVIRTDTFIRNVKLLSRYLAATQPEALPQPDQTW